MSVIDMKTLTESQIKDLNKFKKESVANKLKTKPVKVRRTPWISEVNFFNEKGNPVCLIPYFSKGSELLCTVAEFDFDNNVINYLNIVSYNRKQYTLLLNEMKKRDCFTAETIGLRLIFTDVFKSYIKAKEMIGI